jgi:uncharacterized protein YjiS (DUF1127 family)
MRKSLSSIPGAPARTNLMSLSYELYRAARARRATTVVELVTVAARTVSAAARRAYAAYLQRREATAMCRALRQLDDDILRDLGISRSEISSIVAEAVGSAECTRQRITAVTRDHHA